MQATTFNQAEIEKLVIAAVAEQADIAIEDPNYLIRASLIVDHDGKIGAMVSIRHIVPEIDPRGASEAP